MDICRYYWMSLDLMKDCWLHFENTTSPWSLVACFLTSVVLLWTLTVPLLCRMVQKLIAILIFITTTPKWLWTFLLMSSSRKESCTSVTCIQTRSRCHTAQCRSTVRVSTDLAVDWYTEANRCTVPCHCRLEFDTTSSFGWEVQWREISCVRCVRGNQT